MFTPLRHRLPPTWKNAWHNLRSVFVTDNLFTLKRLQYDENGLQGLQKFLARRAYPFLVAPTTAPRSILNQHEAKFFSQNGEDGILAFIFSQIGTTNHRLVEFGCSDGRENNASNLLINFGWSGLLIEGEKKIFSQAQNFYHRCLARERWAEVTVVNELVTAENINAILAENNYRGAIDLLSIDIDGNDYWVWQALAVIQPRVVVVEYNASLGAERSLTIPYDPQFSRPHSHPSGFYHGASLAALEKLGAARGFRFVGCDQSGTNAFFVRADLATEKLPATTAAAAFYEQDHRRVVPFEKQWAAISHLPFTAV